VRRDEKRISKLTFSKRTVCVPPGRLKMGKGGEEATVGNISSAETLRKDRLPHSE